MSVSSLLSAAAALIATETAWSKGANARDADGNYCPILSPNAESWDLFGALVKARADENETLDIFHSAYSVIRKNIPSDRKNQDIESYNDEMDFGDVAAMFVE